MTASSDPTAKEFRFAYFAEAYEETIVFYRDGLRLAMLNSWDRSPDDRGTVFGAGSGMIEVLALPRSGQAEHLFDTRKPQGAFMVIEVDDVDSYYQTVLDNGVIIHRDLQNQSWGHRSFLVREPNGLTLFIFSKAASARH